MDAPQSKNFQNSTTILQFFLNRCAQIFTKSERLYNHGRMFNRVVIDSHYEFKHSENISDQLILDLVKTLNGCDSLPEKILSNGFEIYVDDPLYLGDKPYRLVWTTHPKERYIGIINAFRTRKRR